MNLQSWKIRQQRTKFYKILGRWFLELLCLSSGSPQGCYVASWYIECLIDIIGHSVQNLLWNVGLEAAII